MIPSPKLREAFEDIAKQTVNYNNTPSTRKKYIRKLIHVFNHTLKEDEQEFVVEVLIEHLHYKTIVTDPENMLNLHNIKLRSMFMGTSMVVIVMVVGYFLFSESPAIDKVLEILTNAYTIISANYK